MKVCTLIINNGDIPVSNETVLKMLTDSFCTTKFNKDAVSVDDENPFCLNCKEADCVVDDEDTCAMVRVYLKAKK